MSQMGKPVLHCIEQNSPHYPQSIRRFLGDLAPDTISTLGNLDLLNDSQKLALFCSVKCPGNLILKLYDFTREVREKGITVIGGFHSPMEKECLELLMRGSQPIIVCLARSLETFHLPVAWRAPLESKRLLLLSSFTEKHSRITARLAQVRNEFVAALADLVLVAYAQPGSKTEAFAQQLISWNKPLLTLDDGANSELVALGASTPDLLFNPESR